MPNNVAKIVKEKENNKHKYIAHLNPNLTISPFQCTFKFQTLTREVRKWDEKMKLAEGEGPIQGRLNHNGGMTYCAVGKYGEAGRG